MKNVPRDPLGIRLPLTRPSALTPEPLHPVLACCRVLGVCALRAQHTVVIAAREILVDVCGDLCDCEGRPVGA